MAMEAMGPRDSKTPVGWECRTKGTARRPLIHSVSCVREVLGKGEVQS